MALLNAAGVKIRDRFRSQANEIDATREIVSFKNCGSHCFSRVFAYTYVTYIVTRLLIIIRQE